MNKTFKSGTEDREGKEAERLQEREGVLGAGTRGRWRRGADRQEGKSSGVQGFESGALQQRRRSEGSEGANIDLQWLVSRHEQPTHLPAEGRGKKQATQHFACNT